jgi:predicted transcriptional regulator
MFVATVQAFNKAGHESDKNGNQNVIFNVIAGKCPSARVVAGTIAIRENFIVGETVLVQSTEDASHETYGRQFSFVNLGKLSPIEIMQSQGQLGAGVVVDIKAAEKPADE